MITVVPFRAVGDETVLSRRPRVLSVYSLCDLVDDWGRDVRKGNFGEIMREARKIQ